MRAECLRQGRGPGQREGEGMVGGVCGRADHGGRPGDVCSESHLLPQIVPQRRGHDLAGKTGGGGGGLPDFPGLKVRRGLRVGAAALTAIPMQGSLSLCQRWPRVGSRLCICESPASCQWCRRSRVPGPITVCP